MTFSQVSQKDPAGEPPPKRQIRDWHSIEWIDLERVICEYGIPR